MLNNMSEAQRLMLRVAASREDRFLQRLENVRGAVAKSFCGKLIEAGWAREVRAANGAPVWRREAASGEAYALKLTPKGLKAVAVACEATEGTGNSVVSTAAEQSTLKAPKGGLVSPDQVPAAMAAANSRREMSPTAARPPRANSKLGRVVGMLSGANGATIGELTTATGWLEHTTRAALTGLRHRGYALSLTKQERDGASVYRITTRGEEVAK